jgi:hypothetical protein
VASTGNYICDIRDDCQPGFKEDLSQSNSPAWAKAIRMNDYGFYVIIGLVFVVMYSWEEHK